MCTRDPQGPCAHVQPAERHSANSQQTSTYAQTSLATKNFLTHKSLLTQRSVFMKGYFASIKNIEAIFEETYQN